MTQSKTLQTLLNESQSYQLTRSNQRQKDLGEVFTPTTLVYEILKKLPKGQVKGVWGEDKTFLDPACGNGQFLAAVLIIKLKLKHDPLTALSTIYGVDIMPDNVKECRIRLAKIVMEGREDDMEMLAKVRKIVKTNIVCEDGLTYDYSFGEKE